MKPIEPGCKCLAFDPELKYSQVCRAVEYAPKGTRFFAGDARKEITIDCWKVDRDLVFKKNVVAIPYVRAAFLIRIDDPDTETKTRELELEHA